MTVHFYGPKPPQSGGSPVETARKIVEHSRGRLVWHELGEEPELPAVVFFSLMNLSEDFADLYRGLPCYTMWEGAVLQPNHARMLRKLGPVAVPSTYCQAAFRTSGFETIVIPHGVDCDVWKPVAKNCEFVSIGYVSIRKNIGDVARAIEVAFPSEPPSIEAYGTATNIGNDWPGLCFKLWSDNLDNAGMRGYLDTLPGRKVWKKMPENLLAGFVGSHEAFVSASLCEGFYLPALEAMAAGVPPIVPKFSGPLDYATDENAWLCKTVPLEAKDVQYPVDPSMRWQRPVVEDMARAMREVVTDDALLKEKSAKARQTALQFPWERGVDLLVAHGEGGASR